MKKFADGKAKLEFQLHPATRHTTGTGPQRAFFLKPARFWAEHVAAAKASTIDFSSCSLVLHDEVGQKKCIKV